MQKLRYFFLCCLIVLCSSWAFAQQQAEMADVMRKNGKIFVVVAVCIIIVSGLFLYLLTLDRKISKFEKENKL